MATAGRVAKNSASVIETVRTPVKIGLRLHDARENSLTRIKLAVIGVAKFQTILRSLVAVCIVRG
jgi:hypothetical protein